MFIRKCAVRSIFHSSRICTCRPCTSFSLNPDGTAAASELTWIMHRRRCDICRGRTSTCTSRHALHSSARHWNGYGECQWCHPQAAFMQLLTSSQGGNRKASSAANIQCSYHATRGGPAVDHRRLPLSRPLGSFMRTSRRSARVGITRCCQSVEADPNTSAKWRWLHRVRFDLFVRGRDVQVSKASAVVQV